MPLSRKRRHNCRRRRWVGRPRPPLRSCESLRERRETAWINSGRNCYVIHIAAAAASAAAAEAMARWPTICRRRPRPSVASVLRLRLLLSPASRVRHRDCTTCAAEHPRREVEFSCGRPEAYNILTNTRLVCGETPLLVGVVIRNMIAAASLSVSIEHPYWAKHS